MPETPNPLRDPITLLLVNGAAVDAVEGYAISRGLDASAARDLVSECRKRITISADYSRDEQIGVAVRRLNELYSKCIQGKDVKTALQIQRELSRLLNLYAAGEKPGGSAPEDDGGNARDRLALIESYLLPLKLIDPRYPVEEHARVAAETLRANGLANL